MIKRTILKTVICLLILFETLSSGITAAPAEDPNLLETIEQLPLEADLLIIQMYGYSGDVAVGFDWLMAGDQFHFIVLLGRAVQQGSGSEIRLLTTKYEWHPFSDLDLYRSPEGYFSLEPWYMGISFYLVDCDEPFCKEGRTFIRLPEKYPDSYYSPTAMTGSLNFGTSIDSRNMRLFLELALSWKGLDAYYRNPEFFQKHYNWWGLEGISSLGFGFKANF